MVVRVFDACEECDEDCSGCYCSATNTSTTPYSTSKSSANRFSDSETTTSCANSCTSNADPSAARNTSQPTASPNMRISCKNLVGNFKEFRIENNKSDLNFIGNGNRIKIINNQGKLNIIGNNTRLKITHNSGQVKYTGNDGRIYLGSDSTQQVVDYTGCNGILKVINSTDLSASCKTQPKGKSSASDIKKTQTGNTMKSKSASFGNIDECKKAHWQHFVDLFQRQSAKSPSCSLPDLTPRCSECGCKCNNAKKSKSDEKHSEIRSGINEGHQKISSIVIKNRIEVTI